MKELQTLQQEIISKLAEYSALKYADSASYIIETNPQPHEANYLKLDCSKVKAELNWNPRWDIESTLESVVDWNKGNLVGKNVREITENQISKSFKNENSK